MSNLVHPRQKGRKWIFVGAFLMLLLKIDGSDSKAPYTVKQLVASPMDVWPRERELKSTSFTKPYP